MIKNQVAIWKILGCSDLFNHRPLLIFIQALFNQTIERVFNETKLFLLSILFNQVKNNSILRALSKMSYFSIFFIIKQNKHSRYSSFESLASTSSMQSCIKILTWLLLATKRIQM